MRQNTVNILSTRILEEESIAMAAKRNILIDSVPFIQVRPTGDESLPARIQGLAFLPQIVVFTSVHAVEAVASCLNHPPPYWQFYCIGNATLSRIKERFGGFPVIEGTGNSAAELTERIAADGVHSRPVYFCGNRSRRDLPDQLSALGIRLEEIVVYLTEDCSPRIDIHYNGILFFSPSAVNSFFSANQAGPDTVFFTIGKTTAAEIRKYGQRKIITPGLPKEEDVIRKAILYFKNNPVNH